MQQKLQRLQLPEPLVFLTSLLLSWMSATTSQEELIAMSEPTTSPHSPEDRQKPRKLLILHLLDSQRQTGGLPPHICDMLQRMTMIICAMSREIYGIAEVNIAPFTVIEKLHWYAACLSEGCTHLLNHIDALDMQARQLANGLPDLEKLNCRSLEECLLVWRATLQ